MRLLLCIRVRRLSLMFGCSRCRRAIVHKHMVHVDKDVMEKQPVSSLIVGRSTVQTLSYDSIYSLTVCFWNKSTACAGRLKQVADNVRTIDILTHPSRVHVVHSEHEQKETGRDDSINLWDSSHVHGDCSPKFYQWHYTSNSRDLQWWLKVT